MESPQLMSPFYFGNKDKEIFKMPTENTPNNKLDFELDTHSICQELSITKEDLFFSCVLLTINRYGMGQDEISSSFLPLTDLNISMETTLAQFFNSVKQGKYASLNSIFSYNNYDNQSLINLKDDINGNVWTSVSLNNIPSSFDSKIGHYILLSFVNCCRLIAENEVPLSVLVKDFDLMCQKEAETLKLFSYRPLENSPKFTPLISLFDVNASINPEKVAIFEGKFQWSYSQLKEASLKIAGSLQSQFSPEKLSSFPFVLVMEKGFEAIATILGVWRAGGYFLPVDAFLQEKLFQLKQTSSKYLALITNVDINALHLVANNWDVLKTGELLQGNYQFKAVPYLKSIQPLSPAYVGMTSGSTGNPKSCVCSQGGVFHLIQAIKQEFELNEDSNLLQWVPFSFDVFILDLIKSLFATNGSITILSQEERLIIQKIKETIKNRRVNYIQMTPQFALFALKEDPRVFARIKTLSLGGETLSWKMVNEMREHLEKETKIYNCYGLTETTIESTSFEVPENKFGSEESVPIGRPLKGIKVLVLDPSTMMQCPVGIEGTLAICGETVGDIEGQIHLSISGEKCHLTGDRVAWLPSGQLEFRRRDESQVKVGGYRINCAELEKAIVTLCPEVEAVIPLTLDDDAKLAVVLQSQHFTQKNELQTQLRELVPYYMVPQVIMSLPQLPLTSNGKVDRDALKKLMKENDKKSNQPTLEILKNRLSQSCNGRIAPKLICPLTNLRDQGFSSLELIKFSNILLRDQIENFEGVSDIFTYPTLQLLAEKIDFQISPDLQNLSLNQAPIINAKEGDDICIVGLSFRLPENTSGSIPSFWQGLNEGKCFVRDFPPNRAEDVLTRMKEPFQSSAVAASFFQNIDNFDHEFFKIAPNEAKHMCPEQRLFLEVATEALVDGGYDLSAISGQNIAVYATASDIDYGLIDTGLDGVSVVGRQSSVVPSRLSYTFNLKGGNYVMDTACSAALVSLEAAVRDLRSGTGADAAIVGGSNIYLYPAKDGLMGTNLIHSASSECRAFDEESDGTVSGEGVFAYLLKRKRDVDLARDHVYATIRSVCSNSVGTANGITAPSVDSQVAVIQKTMALAGVGQEQLHFMETHGTGTILGDQIELCALSTVFASRKNPIVLGAVKPNFGHLDMVAGYLSMLKATLTLTFNSSPGLKYLKKPSKYLNSSIFRTEADKLSTEDETRSFAGISAYGLSGTNCHAVISVDRIEKKEDVTNTQTECMFLLPIQPNSRFSLEKQAEIYSEYLKFYIKLSLKDICATQTLHIVNGLGSKGKIQVALLKVSTSQDLIKILDAIATGVIQLKHEITTMDRDQLNTILPQNFQRVPALPKFFYKNFRHWPEPQKSETTKSVTSPTSSIASLSVILQNKANQVHELTKMAHKLEEMINQLNLSLLQDFAGSSIQNSTDIISPNSVPNAIEEQKIEADSYCNIIKVLKSIWSECIGLSQESIEEFSIFRELGGDSLLTVEMSKKVSAKFGVKIKAADSFSNPSLSSLAALIMCKKFEGESLSSQRFLGMPQKMLMFPGQGSQKIGMCSGLMTSPAAIKIFEEAKAVTGIDILSLCQIKESFESTEFVQLALFVGSCAKVAQLKEENSSLLQGIRVVGGLSVGEFAALVFSEALSFKDALKVVHFRGKAMQEELESGRKTGMVSIYGPDAKELEKWLENNFPDMRISTYLGDNQVAVGGPLESCQKLSNLLNSEEGSLPFEVIDARVLRVAGAFHTEYMEAPGERTGRLIDELELKYPKYGIIMNSDGKVTINKDDIRFNLKKQTASPVMWRDVVKNAHKEMGIRSFVEISPSSVLCPIVQKRIKGVGKSETELARF